MNYADLPPSELVGIASNSGQLALLLDQAAERQPGVFTHADRAIHGPRSCRLLFEKPIEPFTQTAPLPAPYSSHQIAKEFFRNDFLRIEVRFQPQDPPDIHVVHGWEVRKAKVAGDSFIIVQSAWVK